MCLFSSPQKKKSHRCGIVEYFCGGVLLIFTEDLTSCATYLGATLVPNEQRRCLFFRFLGSDTRQLSYVHHRFTRATSRRECRHDHVPGTQLNPPPQTLPSHPPPLRRPARCCPNLSVVCKLFVLLFGPDVCMYHIYPPCAELRASIWRSSRWSRRSARHWCWVACWGVSTPC